ncbi:hypothetical protein ACIBCA_22750 [Kitasatospora sp. NPDC051170]|uniref:hypothetical protein n=1 Tax=Kitasatospora sp. NPDC051170 TaxID=3364056 RepID=UPI0037B1D91C
MRPDREILVEIPGLRPAATHTLNAETLEHLWNRVQFLPMTRPQRFRLEHALTGPCAPRDVLRHLSGHPLLALPIGDHELCITWANLRDGASEAQR